MRGPNVQPTTADEIAAEITHSTWFLKWTGDPKDGRLLPVRFISCWSILPVLTVGISVYERTQYLDSISHGRGLMEHLGSWSQFLMCPLLSIMALELVRRVASIIVDPSLTGAEEARTALEGETLVFQQRLIRIACGRKRVSRILRYGGMLCGLFALIGNIQNTRMATQIYGEDVWDSSMHRYGYLIGKVFLGVEWVFFLPALFVLAVDVGLVVYYIAQSISRHDRHRLEVFAADGCGGFRSLANAILMIVYLNVPIVIIVLALFYTHRHFYATLAVAAGVVIALVLFEFLIPVLHLHNALRRLKVEKLKRLAALIAAFDDQLLTPHAPGPHAIDSYLGLVAANCVYVQTRQFSTWPYMRIDLWKATAPLIPLATATLKLLF